jgi:hypothetical protein
MPSAERYRTLAAELHARARHEVSAEWETLAASYLRLAEQADRNSHNDVTYEPVWSYRLNDFGGEPA